MFFIIVIVSVLVAFVTRIITWNFKHANAQQQVVLPFDLPLKLRKPYTPYRMPGQSTFSDNIQFFSLENKNKVNSALGALVHFSAAK